MMDFFTKLLTPVFITLGLVNPAVVIETPTSNIQVQQELIELRQKVQELENQDEIMIEQVLEEKSIETKPISVKEKTSVIDDSALIQAKIETELKLKAEQEALITKQKLEAEKQIEEQKAIQDAAQAKQKKLNEINKRIADLNSKYLEDIENCTERLRGSGATYADLAGCENPINVKYQNDYNSLQVEFQQAQYN